MPLSYKDVAEIIKLIDESSCDEFVIELDDIKLFVRRRSTDRGQAETLADRGTEASFSPADQAEDSDAPQASGATETPGKVAARTDGLTEIRSPMVGMFYRRPQPDADPFVEVGSEVKPGDALCLVEVMKLFTTLYAELAGRIVEIAAQDGELVEYDQVLFVIEPA